MAALALGELRASAAVERLLSLLADADATVRDFAGLALGRMGSDAIEQQLKALVEAGSPAVKQDAMGALISVSGSPERWVEWARETQDSTIYKAAFDVFVDGVLDGSGLPERTLSDAEAGLLLNAVEACSPPSLRASAIYVMNQANLRSPELDALLVRCVDLDPDPEARAEAAFGLLRRSPQTIDVERVLRIMSADGPDDFTRWLLAGELAKAKEGERLEQETLAALSSSDPPRRAAAIRVLSAMKTASSLAAVSSAASDPSADVRATSVTGLEQAPWSTDLERLLLKLLHDEHADVRRAAARHLGRRRAASTVDALVSALSDRDAGVRRAAVHALSAFDDGRVQAAIFMALGEDEDPGVRGAAASALGERRSEAAVNQLVAALVDPDPGVIEVAIRALGQIGSETAISALVARAPHVAQAREALWKLAAADAADGLLQGSGEPPGSSSAPP